MNHISIIMHLLLLFISSILPIPSPLSDVNINLNIKDKKINGKETTINNEDFMSSTDQDCNCGVRNIYNKLNVKGKRILGGIYTEPHEFPWQVALIKKVNNKLKCGGSIISSKTILTAQHCTFTYGTEDTADTLKIVVGDHNLQYDGDGEKTFEIERIIRLPFDDNIVRKDYALIILKENIPWSYKTKPICLPQNNSLKDEDVMAIVTGWGSTKGYVATNFLPSSILKMAEMRTMNNSDLLDNDLLAYDVEQAPCLMDSGGPLMTKEDGGYYTQIGIVSSAHIQSGGLCGSPKEAPAVFKRVTSELQWIKENMEGKLCSPPKEALHTL